MTALRHASRSIRMTAMLWPLWAIAAASAAAGEDPTVVFDFPRTIACRDVTPPEFAEVSPGEMVVEATLPISVILYRGDVHRIDEVVVEIDGSTYGLRVHGYAPTTRLDSDITKEVEVKTTSEKGNSLEATLGGKLPIPGAEAAACLTPSISALKTDHQVSTETVNRLPPKQAVVVSGMSNQGHAVFYKFRQSSQTTLEGQHEVTLQFIVPRDWKVSELQVTTVARGNKKWLWYDQRQTWGSLISTVQLYRAGDADLREAALARAEQLASRSKLNDDGQHHEVAKPLVHE